MVRFLPLVSLLALGGCHLLFPFDATEPGPGDDAASLDGVRSDAAHDGRLLTDADPAKDAPKDAPNTDGPHKDAGLPLDKGPTDTKPLDKGPPLDKAPPQDAPQPLEAAPPPPCGSWTPVTGPMTTSTNYFNAAWCSGASLFVAGDSGKAFSLTGGGWTDLSPPNVNIEALWASSTTNLYAVGGDQILRYNGSTWIPDQPMKGITLHGLWGSGPSDIYAVGTSGTILRYEGGNWKKKPTPATVATTFYGVWGSGAKDVYAVGSLGTILRFDGITWKIATTSVGTSVTFKDVWGSGAGNVYAVGNAGKIYHFDGVSWKPQTGPSVALDAVWGPGTGCVYAAGNSGQIWFRSSSIGWTKMATQTPYGLMDIHGCAAGTFVVGRVNTILRLKP